MILARRTLMLLLLPVAAMLAVAALPPIAQDPAYHDFADRRGLLGIPNFLNIFSNVAFLAVGGAGMLLCARRRGSLGAARAWGTCFAGVILVSFGSAYYHLAPDNATLVWDRLPMSLGFMALTVAVLADNVHPRLEKILLVPAALIGLASVIYWHYADDLRPYLLVQFLPLLMIPVVLQTSGSRPADRRHLLAALGFYVAAKLAEHFDHAVFGLSGGLLSGHTLKHLLAAAALLEIYRMLRRRTIQ